MQTIDLSSYEPVAGTDLDAVQIANGLATIQTRYNDVVGNLTGGTTGQFLRAASSTALEWATVGGVYRKTTAKDVANSSSETDLLNGEIAVAAGVLGTTGRLRCTLIGDYLNNTGGNATETLRVKLGGTTIWDSGVGGNRSTSATRRPWRIEFEIQNLGAANSQFTQGRFDAPGNGIAATTGIGATSDTFPPYCFASNGTTAVDTSASCALVVSVQLSTASANLSFRLQAAIVEII